MTQIVLASCPSWNYWTTFTRMICDESLLLLLAIEALSPKLSDLHSDGLNHTSHALHLQHLQTLDFILELQRHCGDHSGILAKHFFFLSCDRDDMTVEAHSCNVSLLGQGHVLRQGLPFLLGNLQSFPQTLDPGAQIRATELILCLATVQLKQDNCAN